MRLVPESSNPFNYCALQSSWLRKDGHGELLPPSVYEARPIKRYSLLRCHMTLPNLGSVHSCASDSEFWDYQPVCFCDDLHTIHLMLTFLSCVP